MRARNVEQKANLGLSLTDPLSGNSEWSAGYRYDGAGNLVERVDARGVRTAYTYDGLNRLGVRSYSDSTPGVSYVYGDSQAPFSQRGRLLSVTASLREGQIGRAHV